MFQTQNRQHRGDLVFPKPHLDGKHPREVPALLGSARKTTRLIKTVTGLSINQHNAGNLQVNISKTAGRQQQKELWRRPTAPCGSKSSWKRPQSTATKDTLVRHPWSDDANHARCPWRKTIFDLGSKNCSLPSPVGGELATIPKRQSWGSNPPNQRIWSSLEKWTQYPVG